jgi:MFS family permease
MSRTLALLFVTSFGGAVSFYLLLSVVPLYATTLGAGGVGAGAVTGALMFATVAGEFVTPRLLARYGPRPVLAVGLVLLGAPVFLLPAAGGLPGILAVCVVRGFGFAIVVVLGSALVAAAVPASRRGEGLGLLGLVIGVPSVLVLPLGVWLVRQVGYPPVFIAGAVASLAGLLALVGNGFSAPPQSTVDATAAPIGIRAGLRSVALRRPGTVFAATALACGVVVTFVPLAVGPGHAELAAVALFAQAVTATITRWWAGRIGDRRGAGGLVLPGVLAAGIGMLGLVFITSPVAVVAGMLLFGAGFGVAQNASLAVMFDRVAPSGYGTVSALWNLAYDAGLGLGAVGFGVVAAQTGYPIGFALTAALVLAALVPAAYDRRHPGSPRGVG